MKVEKEKRKAVIVCTDGSLVKGLVHINPGERMIDFLNDLKEGFIAVTNVEFYNIKEVHSFRLFEEMRKRKDMVILNKSAIKLVEQL
jgi:ribonucleotide monophosphatase NagD (HAD superfamily)